MFNRQSLPADMELWKAYNASGDELLIAVRKDDPDHQPVAGWWVWYFGSDVGVLNAHPAQLDQELRFIHRQPALQAGD
jgi:hypothetical protein